MGNYRDGRPLTRARAGPKPPPNATTPRLSSWESARPVGCGLVNLGNSCFLNAVLQALAHCPPLANTVWDAPMVVGGGSGSPGGRQGGAAKAGAGGGPSGTAAGGAAGAAAPDVGSAHARLLPAFGGPCGAPACGQLYEDGGPGGLPPTSNRGGAAGVANGAASNGAHLAIGPTSTLARRPVPCAHCLLWSRVRRSLAPDTPHPDAPKELWENLRATISRTLTPGRQEDAHEFLRTLLDAADRDRRRGLAAAAGGGPPLPASAWVSEVDAAFGGRLLSRVTCAACGAHSDTVDPCLDLSVEVGPGVATLGDALAAFARPEPLAGADAYRCAGCGTVGPATKRLALSSTPAALVIHLKRFAASASGAGRGAGRAGLAPGAAYGHAATAGGAPPPCGHHHASAFPLSPSPHPGPLPAKITRHIPFPATLTLGGPILAPGTRPGPPYTLTGVVVHAGPSPRGGHYTALVRGRGGAWFLADDGRVARVGAEAPDGGFPGGLGAVLGAQAYILFYARAEAGPATKGRGGGAGAGAGTPPPPRVPVGAGRATAAAAPPARRPSRSPSPKAGAGAGTGAKRPAPAPPATAPPARRRRSGSGTTPPPAAGLTPAHGPPSRLPQGAGGASAPPPARISYAAPLPPRSRAAVGAPPRTRGAFLVATAVAKK